MRTINVAQFFSPFRRTGTNINTTGVDRASAHRRPACPPSLLLNGWKRREEMNGKDTRGHLCNKNWVFFYGAFRLSPRETRTRFGDFIKQPFSIKKKKNEHLRLLMMMKSSAQNNLLTAGGQFFSSLNSFLFPPSSHFSSISLFVAAHNLSLPGGGAGAHSKGNRGPLLTYYTHVHTVIP